MHAVLLCAAADALAHTYSIAVYEMFLNPGNCTFVQVVVRIRPAEVKGCTSLGWNAVHASGICRHHCSRATCHFTGVCSICVVIAHTRDVVNLEFAHLGSDFELVSMRRRSTHFRACSRQRRHRRSTLRQQAQCW